MIKIDLKGFCRDRIASVLWATRLHTRRFGQNSHGALDLFALLGVYVVTVWIPEAQPQLMGL